MKEMIERAAWSLTLAQAFKMRGNNRRPERSVEKVKNDKEAL